MALFAQQLLQAFQPPAPVVQKTPSEAVLTQQAREAAEQPIPGFSAGGLSDVQLAQKYGLSLYEVHAEARLYDNQGLPGDAAIHTRITNRQQAAREAAEPAIPGFQIGGFSDVELAKMFGLNLYTIHAEGRIFAGQPAPGDSAVHAKLLTQRVSDPYFGTENQANYVQRTFAHYIAHPKGSRYRGDFNIGTAINAFVGVITLGTAPDLRSFFSGIGEGRIDFGKIQFNVPFSGAHINKLSHDVVSLYSGQQAPKGTYKVLDSETAQILDKIIGGTAAAVIGYAGYNYGALTPASAAPGTLSQSPQLIGVTEASLQAPGGAPIFQIGGVTDYTLAGVTSASLGEPAVVGGGILSTIGNGLVQGAKFVGGAVVAGFVQKLVVGVQKFTQDILRGNFKDAVNDLVSGIVPGQGQESGPQPSALTGGYGGGGGGYGGTVGTQAQSSMLLTLLPIGLVLAVVITFAYFYKRKR